VESLTEIFLNFLLTSLPERVCFSLKLKKKKERKKKKKGVILLVTKVLASTKMSAKVAK